MSDCEVRYLISSAIDSAMIVEVVQTKPFGKNIYFLSFESFAGELHYVHNHPERSRLKIEVDVQSISCRDRRLSSKKRRRVAECAKNFVRNAAPAFAIQFSSQRISAKPLRGFVIEGGLTARDQTRIVKINAAFSAPGADHVDIEGDSILRLSDFGLKAPLSFFGVIRTSDQVLVQFHLHGVRTSSGEVLSPRPVP